MVALSLNMFQQYILQNLDIQTNELERAMGEDLVHTASNYIGQFGDLKKKVNTLQHITPEP